MVLRGGRAPVVRRANPPMSGRWGFPGRLADARRYCRSGLPTAPALLLLIDLAIADLLRNRSTR
jgi:hypothetical protein